MDAVSLAFIVTHYDELQNFVRARCGSRNSNCVDDVWSDVVLVKVPLSINTFDLSYGRTIEQHVFANLRWYIARWFKERNNGKTVNESDLPPSVKLERVGDDESVAIETREYVATLLGRLCEYDRTLLRLRFWGGFTNVKIAEYLNSTEPTIRNHLKAALDNALRSIYT